MNGYCKVLFRHIEDTYGATAQDQMDGVLNRLLACRYRPECPQTTECRDALSAFIAKRPDISPDRLHRLSTETPTTTAGYRFRTIHDVLDVLSQIVRQFPELASVELALWELMVNAVEHGNLEIGFDRKSELLEHGQVIDEIERRLEDPRYKDRVATVRIERLMDKSVVTIADEGPGFDWARYIQKDMGDVDGLHGRGVLLAKAAAKSLRYTGTGNTVVVEHDDGRSFPA